jgi:membrane-bound ClpP family serine protease
MAAPPLDPLNPLNLPNETLWTGAKAYQATVKAVVPKVWVVFRGEWWQARLVTNTFQLQEAQKVLVVGRDGTVLQITAIPSL